MIEWFRTQCEKFSVLGRCRVGREGVNANMSGDPQSVAALTEACRQHPSGAFSTTDFKVAPVSPDTAFTKLLVWRVAEICALGLREEEQQKLAEMEPGEHLSAEAWHKALEEAKGTDTVLIDTRNIYETRIGNFQGT